MKKSILMLLPFFCITPCLNAQDTVAVKFYDFIATDSVVMYFDKRNDFTGEECARYRRYVKLDSLGNFTGVFTDYDEDGLTARGYYLNGIKEGVFETYYTGGTRIKSSGSFKNNRPSGYWNYYYGNGKMEKQLLFNAADTLLLEYYDVQGHHLVKKGNGHFNGMVGVAGDPYYSTLATAIGEVVNGKPDGTWTSRMGGTPYCTERFAKGIFISGKLPKHLVKDKEDYFDFSSFDILYQPSPMYRLEEFHVAPCDPEYVAALKKMKLEKEKNGKNAGGNLESVRSYVQDAVEKVTASDVRNGNITDYQAGENLFKIAFTINEKGIPTDFKRVTSWGDQFFNPVTTALSLHLIAPYNRGSLFIVIIITKDASNYLTSQFYFSKE